MRRTSLLTASGLIGALLALAPAGPAAAEQVYDRPVDGVFQVEGHGWGHGRGMSQWGAQGAASLGRTADQITAAYYPGTERAVLPDTPIRVWLSGDEGRDTVVWPADGLRATDLTTGDAAVLPDGPSRWRATVDAAGLHLSGLTDGAWTPFLLGGRSAFAGPLRFSGAGLTRVGFPGGSSRDYRGAVQAVRSGSGLRTVVVLGLEDYLLGVVPRESSSGWRPAALQAQAIAARSYSANKRMRVGSGAVYDICDTTACQVFGGTRLYTAAGRASELEPASTSDAVRATAGVVRTSGGRPIFAEFSSSNGGWSTGGDVPYLQAREDPWDGEITNPVHSWRAALPVSALERRYPQLGSLQRLRVTRRDGNGEWGGRVKQVVLEGTAGSVTTTGSGVYSAATWPATGTGLRSTWFHFVGQSAPATVPGSAPAPAPSAPAPASSEVVEQSPAPRLVRPPGASTASLSVTLRNTGTGAWPAAGLHLALASPAGAPDPLASGSTRPGRYTGSADVAPGGLATFVVDLDAAGVAAGSYDRAYALRLGAGPLVGAPVTWQVNVDEARFTAVRAEAPRGANALLASGGTGAPSAVFADGHTVVVPRTGRTAVRMRVRNTGNVVWPGDGTVQLGTSGPRDRASAAAGTAWLSPKRAAPMNGSSAVRPGGVGAFDLVLHGADRPAGLVFEQFEPVWTGRHWLDGATTRMAVVRVDPRVPRLAGLHNAPRALQVAREGSTVLVFRLRNLGGSAWTVGTDVLTTAAPERLRTAAWLSPTRPPALARNASRPGVTKVYPGEIGEWRVPLSAKGAAAGTYSTVLQAVAAAGRYGPRTTTVTTVR